MSVSIILPALDEAASIAAVVRDLAGLADELLVVDNGSTDGTGAIAAAAGARVILEPRRGFGAACWAGTVAAAGDVLCFLDADGTFLPSDARRVIAVVSAGRSDLCLGSRTRTRNAAMRADHRLANRLLGRSLVLVGGPRLTDIGPLRAIRRDQLIDLDLRDRAYAWPLEMIVRAAAAGLRIEELEIGYRPRSGGRSKVSGSLRGSARAGGQMTRLLLREALR